MLVIHNPEIVEREGEVRLQARFECGTTNDVLWFSTTQEHGKYLCHERGDPFLVALLLYAMERGEDIHILAPISERLYYTLTKHFIKTITHIFPGFKEIKIICETDSRMVASASGVGTGLSCGIDSFFTVLDHTSASCPPGYRLTHLTFFNVGASGDHGGEGARSLFHQRIDAIRPCADELGMPLVTLDSNISDVLQMNFPSTHTFRNIAAVLAIQKLFRLYYYSSGYPLTNFELSSVDSCHYDAYGLNMLSTETTQFFSSGENHTRVEKTNVVSNSPLSLKYLNVCAVAESNCSRCKKCQRTLLTLDIMGKLDSHHNVFDLNDYRANRSKYFGQMLGCRKYDASLQEIYDAVQKEKYPIPFTAHLYSLPALAFQIGMDHAPRNIKKLYRRSFLRSTGKKLRSLR